MSTHVLDGSAYDTRPNPQIPTKALVVFVLLTFAISWGLAGFYLFLPDIANSTFGELSGLHPIYFLMTWGPGIAGILVVLIFAGISGLKSFMSRLFLWRVDMVWWLLVLVGIPLIYMIGSLINGGGLIADLPDEGLGVAFAIMFLMLFLGPMEEFGWRGVLQPLLQRLIAPFWTGALIGLIWAVWHLPAFYLSGVVYSDWSFLPFLIGCVSLAILVTPIFNASRGGLLLPILFHWQLIIPFWPDAQPWDTWMMVALAAIICWVKRDMMFSRAMAVTRVIPG